MDKYEEMQRRMSQMNPVEKNALLERNRTLCNCPKCPTYTPCMEEKGERMFCWIGKSTCTVDPTGCLCPSCPVAAIMGYTHTYYCTGGPEQEMRKVR